MLNSSSSTILSTNSLTTNQALEFLKTDDMEMITLWKNSAKILTDKIFDRQITFTTNIFLPLTFLCRNSCGYCGFKRVRVPTGKEYMKSEKVDSLLKKAKNQGVSEVLITMGEKPELNDPKAKHWLLTHGFDSTVEYSRYICEKILDYGILPHINAGTLTYNELKDFRDVTASIGLMLENISERLTKQGMPHAKSPDKYPNNRMKSIRTAGKLKIPFTSGLLIGIGETHQEIVSSLYALRNVHLSYGHLQEVIIQNFQPYPNTNMAKFLPPSINFLEKVLILSRHILPPEISIQVPPNLVKGYEQKFIEAGISDWGGISSITHDYINPYHKWPYLNHLKDLTQERGYNLRERLPVYPRYIKPAWLSPRVHNFIIEKRLMTKDGYRRR